MSRYRMGKRGTLIVDGQRIRRVPIWDLGDGLREVEPPLGRIRTVDNYYELPDTATVIHAGNRYTADLIREGGDSGYVFEVG